MRTFSLPQKRLAKIYKITSLLANDSVGFLSRRMSGAINTGDSKHMASSFKNLLFARKFRLGRSMAKLMNLSLSFYSIRAVVLLM